MRKTSSSLITIIDRTDIWLYINLKLSTSKRGHFSPHSVKKGQKGLKIGPQNGPTSKMAQNHLFQKWISVLRPPKTVILGHFRGFLPYFYMGFFAFRHCLISGFIHIFKNRVTYGHKASHHRFPEEMKNDLKKLTFGAPFQWGPRRGWRGACSIAPEKGDLWVPLFYFF